MAYARTKMEDKTTAELITEAIGEKEHCLMNYTPAMMTALAMDQALKMVDVGTEQRIGAIRKIGHKVRRAVNEYGYYLATQIEDVDGYNAVIRDFDGRTTTEQWLKELKEQEDAKNTSECLYPEAAAHLHAAISLLRYVQAYDTKKAAMLSRILGRTLHRRLDPKLREVLLILEECSRIEGMQAKRTATSEQWLKVIENKCRDIITYYQDEYKKSHERT